MSAEKETQDINRSYGEIVSESVLRIKRVMPADAETVWAYLTEAKKSAQWLGAVESDLTEGAAFHVTFQHTNLTDEPTPPEMECHQGNVTQGKILTYDPYKTFTYTWMINDVPTEVRYDLVAQGAETLLTLTHSKLPNKNTMRSVGPGWHTHLDLLVSRLAGAPIAFWAAFFKLQSDYKEMIQED